MSETIIAVDPCAQEDSVRLWSVRTLPRSREVGQSYVTSVWSTIRATGAAIKVVFEETPQVVWT